MNRSYCCRSMLSVVVLGGALASTGCEGKSTEGAKPATTTATTATTATPAAGASTAAPTNPAVAELAPLWAEIAKCEDLSDLYAKDKCPANFKLLETIKDAYAAVDQEPKRFADLYDAVVDQVISGTSLKARNCAAYAAWSKGYRGGKQFEANEKMALALIGAMGKLDKEDGGVGYGIANMLGGWWKKDGEPRKAMVAAIQDRTLKAENGRRELIRHAGWVAKDVPDVLAAIRTVATDTSDAMPVRSEAIAALGGVLKDRPELVETMLFLTAEPNQDAQKAAISGLSWVKPGSPEATKAQAKLLELLGTPEPNPLRDPILRSLARFADLDGLKAIAAFYSANAAQPNLTYAYASVLNTMASSGRFKDDAAADTALRAGINAVLKGKDSKGSDKSYALQALGYVGGPKSVAACKKFSADSDKAVADAAVKCIEKASASTSTK